MRIRYALILAAVLPGPAGAETSSPPAGEPVTTAPSTVVAEMRGRTLTWGQVQAAQNELNPKWSDQDVIDMWKRSAVLADEFRKSGMMDEPAVQAAVDIMTQRMLGEIYVHLRRKRAEVTDRDIAEFYEKQKDMPHSEFRESDIVTVQLIADKKREDVEKIKDRLKEGADFDKLVAEYADTTTRTLGVPKPVLEDIAAMSLRGNLGIQAYALSRVPLDRPNGPMKVPNGWVMFMVTERRTGAMKPLDAVADRIRSRLIRVKQNNVARQIVRQAEAEAGIKPATSPTGPARANRPGRRPVPKPHSKTQPAADTDNTDDTGADASADEQDTSAQEQDGD